MLWDSDGKAYFLGTNFADGYKSCIMPMSPDGRSIDRTRAVLVNEGHGREASKLLKAHGWYYLIFSEHFPDKGRYVVARRARHPLGPWSDIKQLAEPSVDANEPNQGGIVEATSGRSYFFTHHGRQGWEGRAASLLRSRRTLQLWRLDGRRPRGCGLFPLQLRPTLTAADRQPLATIAPAGHSRRPPFSPIYRERIPCPSAAQATTSTSPRTVVYYSCSSL